MIIQKLYQSPWYSIFIPLPYISTCFWTKGGTEQNFFNFTDEHDFPDDNKILVWILRQEIENNNSFYFYFKITMNFNWQPMLNYVFLHKITSFFPRPSIPKYKAGQRLSRKYITDEQINRLSIIKYSIHPMVEMFIMDFGNIIALGKTWHYLNYFFKLTQNKIQNTRSQRLVLCTVRCHILK